jgi:hypothetical protein
VPLDVTYSTGSKRTLTLQDIEDIYLGTRDWDRTTPIQVRHYDSQRDGSSSSITVKMDPRKNNAPKPAKRSPFQADRDLEGWENATGKPVIT